MQRILMVGKPNCGKSLLFNQLTGLRQKVANYPGITVEVTRGKCDKFELVDLPGAYSLNGLTRDELVAVEEIKRSLAEETTAAVLVVLDATRLSQSLVIGLQAKLLAEQYNRPVMFVVNFIDEVKRVGENIDTEGLSQALNCPVMPISARSLDGIHEFKQALLELAEEGSAIPSSNVQSTSTQDEVAYSQQLSKQYGIKQDLILAKQNAIDSFLLNNWLGGFIFIAVMFGLFQSVFTFAGPLMDGVESGIEWMANVVGEYTSEGIFHDFMNDAIFGGFGSFLVFVPQIMVLTLIIGILEDSGYFARAALICHRPLSFFGLSGRSFIPYLSGHACAIPAIMAARTIESPRKRLVTMLTVPLMSCSARLPVYALLVAVLVPADASFLGFFNLQGVAFFGLYLFGIIMALVVSQILNKFLPKDLESTDMPFILEMPTYRLPHWKPLYQRVINSGVQFIRRAGPVIFMVSAGIWVLGYFPLNSSLEESWLGQIGKVIGPVFEPMGVDWRYGVAILMSFLAREVFVGALGTLFGMEGADEDIAGLADRIQQEGLSPEAGLGLVLFYVVALQCVATVAVLKGESGSAKLSWGVYVAYGLLAYSISVITFQIFSNIF